MRGPWAESCLQLVLLAIGVAGGPAAGAGGHGTQGPLFLGRGLDDVKPAMGGGSVTKGIQQYSLGTIAFPPMSEIGLTPSVPPAYKLRELSCSASASNSRLAFCTSFFDFPRQVCDQEDATKTKVNLIAINAGWNGASAALDLGQNNSVVFACKVPDPTIPDIDDRFGAIGKCVAFGFFERPDMQLQFLACVRATRADYCSNGVSLTAAGTPYAIYDIPAVAVQICQPGECYEASWNEGGAICMNHRRYSELVYIAASKAAVWRDVKTGTTSGQKKSAKPVKTKETVVAPETAAKAPKPPQPPQPPQPNALLNCAQPSPLVNCLNKFTSYYFNDALSMKAPSNPVDSVTAQFVCQPAFRRTATGTILTRTGVRFLNSSGIYEPHDCCDTLGDCCTTPLNCPPK